MGNSNSINKVSFQDIQKIINNKKFIVINTLDVNNQSCLIKNTVTPDKETELINAYLSKSNDINIVIYGENCNDDKLLTKYTQLSKLGFPVRNIYIYLGGLFEWLLLQDIYGDDEFPTTKKELDILKYKAANIY